MNTFGPSNLTALVLNNSPDERKDAVEFMARMPYTFVNAQADVKFWMNFVKSCEMGTLDSVLLDPDGRVVYGAYPNSVAAEQRFGTALKLLLAHEKLNSETKVAPHFTDRPEQANQN